MKHPKTVTGWAQLAVAVLAILGTIGGAGWQFYRANAWGSDVERVEEYASEGIKTSTCMSLDLYIQQLQRRKAEGDNWTASDESHLQSLLRKYDRLCKEDS